MLSSSSIQSIDKRRSISCSWRAREDTSESYSPHT